MASSEEIDIRQLSLHESEEAEENEQNSDKGHHKHSKKGSKKKPLSKKKEKALQREQERKSAVFAAFSKFYEDEFGTERWTSLLEALKKPVRHCIMLNKYADPEDVAVKLTGMKDDLQRLDFLSIPCFATSQARFPPPSKDRHNISDYYILDAGSVLATEALDIRPEDRILDLCAAPGGKSLSVLQRLSEKYGQLTANELSPDRRRRLRQVMESYLPPRAVQAIVTVTGRDGTRWYGEPEQYDKVLLDAPCSSERHLLHDDKEFEQWTPKRTQQNAKRQLALLKAAVFSLQVGGQVVYGTCSISSLENDKVIDKIIKKGKVPVKVVRKSWAIGEATKYGWIILPDTTGGWGPLYFCVLQRTGVSKEEGSDLEDSENDFVESEDEVPAARKNEKSKSGKIKKK